MWLMGGLTGAMVAGYAVWALAGSAVRNLPGVESALTLIVLVAVGLVCGFLGGAAVFRRAWRSRDHLVLYASMAGAVCGAVIGASIALALSAGYLGAYAAWPGTLTGDALMAAAYPVFALLGVAIGSVAGGALGLVGGGVLRVLGPAR